MFRDRPQANATFDDAFGGRGTAAGDRPGGGDRVVTLLGTGVLGLQGLLGVALLVAGGTKLADEEIHVSQFEHFGYPQWFRTLTGSTEVLAALALLAGVVTTPLVGLVGGGLAAVVMVGALASHVRIGDDVDDMTGPLVLLVLAAVVTAYHAVGVVG